jgi:hypothetical protein
MHALTIWEGFKTQRLLILYPHKRMVCNWVANNVNIVNSLMRENIKDKKITDGLCNFSSTCLSSISVF